MCCCTVNSGVLSIGLLRSAALDRFLPPGYFGSAGGKTLPYKSRTTAHATGCSGYFVRYLRPVGGLAGGRHRPGGGTLAFWLVLPSFLDRAHDHGAGGHLWPL